MKNIRYILLISIVVILMTTTGCGSYENAPSSLPITPPVVSPAPVSSPSPKPTATIAELGALRADTVQRLQKDWEELIKPESVKDQIHGGKNLCDIQRSFEEIRDFANNSEFDWCRVSNLPEGYKAVPIALDTIVSEADYKKIYTQKAVEFGKALLNNHGRITCGHGEGYPEFMSDWSALSTIESMLTYTNDGMEEPLWHLELKDFGFTTDSFRKAMLQALKVEVEIWRKKSDSDRSQSAEDAIKDGLRSYNFTEKDLGLTNDEIVSLDLRN